MKNHLHPNIALHKQCRLCYHTEENQEEYVRLPLNNMPEQKK